MSELLYIGLCKCYLLPVRKIIKINRSFQIVAIVKNINQRTKKCITLKFLFLFWRFSKYFDAPHKDKKQEYFQEIYKKLQESHEKRVKKLYEQQNQEWSNLKEELNQEMILCQNLKPTFLPTCEIGNFLILLK